MKKHALMLGTVVLLGVSTIFPEKASAWFEVCNRSQSEASVAFAYLDIADNRNEKLRRANADGSPQPWFSEGWWNLKPGDCRKVYPHELWRRNRYYYVYANSRDGKRLWSGNYAFCTSPNEFTIDNSKRNCPERRGFQQIDIGGGRVRNYTYELR